MAAVSQLVGRAVENAAGDEIGRVVDLVVRETGDAGYPKIAGLLLKVGRRRSFVEGDQIERLDGERVRLVSARLVLDEFVRRPGEVLLVADVLDHQLVDVGGVRVVRAADLYLAPLSGAWHLVAVDVGLGALVRRMRPSRGGRARTRVKPDRVLDWAAVQPLTGPSDGPLRLRGPAAELHTLRPGQLADLLAELGREERSVLLEQLADEAAADALEEAEPEHVVALLHELAPERATAVLSVMEPDEAVEALRDLDPEDREVLLAGMNAEVADQLHQLLAYRPDTAGGVMTTTIVTVDQSTSVDDVRALLRDEVSHGGEVDAVIVIDDDGVLVDDVTAFELLVAWPEQTMSDLCGAPFPVAVAVDAPLEETIEQFIEVRGASIVVVDDANRPLGRIHADDLVDALFRRKGRRPHRFG